MAPRRGGYITNPTWQADVLAKLRVLGVTEKEFAHKMGCAQSTMHDTLHRPGKMSHLVPKINKALKWPAPPEIPGGSTVPLPTPDATEIAAMYDLLPEEIRKIKIAEFRAMVALYHPDKSND